MRTGYYIEIKAGTWKQDKQNTTFKVTSTSYHGGMMTAKHRDEMFAKISKLMIRVEHENLQHRR